MAYVLEDILRIRLMRENMAKEAVSKALNALNRAIQLVKKRKKELEDFKVFRVEEEERLYEQIINKKVKRIDMDILKGALADLKKQQADKAVEVTKAEREREDREKELSEARATYNAAIVERVKIDEHKDIWMQDYKKEQEALAEKELEDFRVRQLEEAL